MKPKDSYLTLFKFEVSVSSSSFTCLLTFIPYLFTRAFDHHLLNTSHDAFVHQRASLTGLSQVFTCNKKTDQSFHFRRHFLPSEKLTKKLSLDSPCVVYFEKGLYSTLFSSSFLINRLVILSCLKKRVKVKTAVNTTLGITHSLFIIMRESCS